MFTVGVCDRHVSTANEVCLCNPLITATTHNSAIIVFLFGTDWLAGIKTKRTITQIQQKNTLFLLGPGADDNWPRSRDCYANNIITRRERCPVPGSMFMNCLTYEAIICCCVPSEHTHPKKKQPGKRTWLDGVHRKSHVLSRVWMRDPFYDEFERERARACHVL